MRSPRLIPATALAAAAAIGSAAAFQVPVDRTIAATTVAQRQISSLQALPLPSMKRVKSNNNNLFSRLSRFGTQKLRSRRAKTKANEKPSNKRILALVTTCCLALLARPTASQATMAFFLDPTTLTYEEVPGLGLLPNGVPTYNTLGAIELVSHKSLVFFAKALVATTLLAWVFGGLVYSLSLGQFEPIASKGANARQEEAKHAEWSEYSQRLLDASKGMVKKVKRNLTADQETKEEDETSAMEEASRFYQEQKYKLHHHPVHVPQSTSTSPSYLDSLTINESTRHDGQGSYLDSLSGGKRSTWGEYAGQMKKLHTRAEVDDRMKIQGNMLTWEDYKHLVGELQDRKNEVNDLKQEAEHLKSLLQIEQSIHQAVPNAVADTEVDELKEFDKMAKEYEAAVKKSSLKDEVDADWHASRNGLGSGIK